MNSAGTLLISHPKSVLALVLVYLLTTGIGAAATGTCVDNVRSIPCFLAVILSRPSRARDGGRGEGDRRILIGLGPAYTVPWAERLLVRNRAFEGWKSPHDVRLNEPHGLKRHRLDPSLALDRPQGGLPRAAQDDNRDKNINYAGSNKQPEPFLPNQFAGWQIQGAPNLSDDPAVADSAYAAVLKEYGFNELESAIYSRPDRKLSVKAARFNDATGAYGAFTFYKSEGMETEKIGDLAASAGTKVLFYRGNILVEAELDRVTAMSAAELRELASSLPQPTGNNSKLPTLPTYLPRQSYIAHSAKYVQGPAGFSNIQGPLPVDLVQFDRGAELVLGRYSSSKGIATMVLIAYPTPQIAGDRLRAIESWMKTSSCSAPKGTREAGCDFFGKRSGPIVALVTGNISATEAHSLLASVSYDADVTWNEATSLSKKDNIGSLIIAAFTLIGILILIALAIGLAFGGLRVLLQRFFPNRWFDRPEDVEIIRLNLKR